MSPIGTVKKRALEPEQVARLRAMRAATTEMALATQLGVSRITVVQALGGSEMRLDAWERVIRALDEAGDGSAKVPPRDVVAGRGDDHRIERRASRSGREVLHFRVVRASPGRRLDRPQAPARRRARQTHIPSGIVWWQESSP